MRTAILCNNQILIVKTNIHEVFDYVLSLKYLHTFPLSILKYFPENKNIACLNILNSNDTELNFEEKSRILTLKLKWKNFNKSKIIESFLLQLLFLSSIDSGIFPIHASAISINNKAYLIVGATGSGKTSLSISLCYKEKFNWLADDQANLVIKKGEIFISDGHDLITFRKLPFRQIANNIPNSIRKKICSSFLLGNSPYVKTKHPFYPEELRLHKGKLPCKVEKIFFPLITNSYEYCEKLLRENANVIIFHEFVKSLNGIGSYLIDNDGNIIHQPIVMGSKKGWNDICNFVNFLSSKCQMYMVQTSFKQAMSFITSKILERDRIY